MIPSSLAVLHGAPGAEIGPATYFARVVVHLFALGVVAVLAYLASSLAGTVRAAITSD